MKSLTYIEIDVDYCALTYGSSPCTASIGVTGERKCYNTFKTCQDQANFDNAPKTIRFAEASAHLPGDIECFPNIKPSGINYTPQKIKPGKSLGERASVTITFDDHQDTDSYIDKYLSERPFNPWDRGTFWGKFRARLPYIKGRPLRLITGVLGQTIGEMETRHFIIESTSGPDANGSFKITAKDMLKIADGDRAQAPKKSNGILFTLIDEDDGGLTLAPSGIGDLEYPTSGHASIGEECVAFTRSGDSVTLTERGAFNTVPAEHAAGDLFQIMLSYVGESAAVILQDLFVTYAEADPSTVPYDEWVAELGYIEQVYTARIGNPTAVVDLVDELIEQVGLVMWWDEMEQLIKLRSMRPVVGTSVTVDDTFILAGSLKPSDQPNLRVSQVWTSFYQVNPLESLDRQSNYASGAVTIDAQSELDHGMPAIHKVFSRWIGAFNRQAALRLNAQILSRYRDPPRKFSFAVHRYEENVNLLLGRGFTIMAHPLQDDTGAQVPVYCVVTSVLPQFDKYVIEAEEMLFTTQEDLSNERLIVIDQPSFNVNLRHVHDTIFNEPVGGEVIRCVIELNAMVGSLDAFFPSFVIGDWPADVDIIIDNYGQILGGGGRGGSWPALPQQGGVAFESRYPITMNNLGRIAGGGGGGGSSGGGNSDPRGPAPYVGGAGGAGFNGLIGSTRVGGPAGASFIGGTWVSRGSEPPAGYVFLPPPGNPAAGGRGAGQHNPAPPSRPLPAPLAGGNIGGSVTYPNYAAFASGRGGDLAGAGVGGYVYTSDWPSNDDHGWMPVGATAPTQLGAGGGWAVDGESYITYTNVGDIIGTRGN